MIRQLVYMLGFRPDPDSVFFSPSLDASIKSEAAIRKVYPSFVFSRDPGYWKIDALPGLPSPTTPSEVRVNKILNLPDRGHPPTYQNDGIDTPCFFCPCCGGPLESNGYYYSCVHHGVAGISMTNRMLVVSIKP